MPWIVSGLFLSSGLSRSTAVPYSGPGDVVSGASGWWGLRAYSNAKIGSNCIRIRRDSDNTEQDFVTLGSGYVDVAGISSFVGAGSGFVTKLYDQSGTGNDLSQATAANQPQFTFNALGSYPSMTFVRASHLRLLNGTATNVLHNISISAVYYNSSSGTGAEAIFGNGAGSYGVYGSDGVADTIELYTGSAAYQFSAARNTWHRVQSMSNDTANTRALNIDGSDNSGSSTPVADLGSSWAFGGDPTNEDLDGMMMEGGVWNIAFTAQNRSDLASNQSTYWGI